MGEAQTLHFLWFRDFRTVTKPQNQLFLSLETPGHLNKKQEKTLGPFKHIIFYKYHNFGIPFFVFEHFSKRRAPTRDEDSFNVISKILDMYFISIKKHDMEVR